jgi:putative restriction endonuclease
MPESWSPNIVTFKNTTEVSDGLKLWDEVSDRISRTDFNSSGNAERFGEPRLVKPRLGQGAFRILVTDIYDRKCAITQERTLPALEAAHIRP